MTKKRIVRMSLDEIIARGGGRTDWARVDKLTDAEVAAAVASDPDAWSGPINWTRAKLVYPPRKHVINLGVDEEVLAFFKRQGKGYQTRMNAVLRTYMVHHVRDAMKAGAAARKRGELAEPKPSYRAKPRKK